jgi:tRNA(Ile)-lysidine synthase
MMRVIKGASLKGLAGISAVSYWKSLRIVRPLLDIEKKEICRRLDSMKLQYRIDSSNLEDIYFRNVVRGEILPYLEKYNPRVKRSLANLAAHLAEDLAFLTDTKRKAKAGVTATAGESSSIPIADLVVQPKAVRKEVLRDMMESAGGEVKKLSFRHWKELDVLITSKKRGNCVDLPGGVRARRCDKSIALHKL